MEQCDLAEDSRGEAEKMFFSISVQGFEQILLLTATSVRTEQSS